MEITLHTGFMGDQNIIHIEWYDENNVTHEAKLEIWVFQQRNVKDQDKPREIEIFLNDEKLGELIKSSSKSSLYMPVDRCSKCDAQQMVDEIKTLFGPEKL